MNNNEFPKQYKILKDLYGTFARKMDKSDFANSPQRYISELSYIRNLKNTAKELNIESEIQKMTEKEDIVCKKLSEFGISIAE